MYILGWGNSMCGRGLKEKVLAADLQTLAERKDKIAEKFRRIDAATLEGVLESALSHARSCVAHNGAHLT